MSDQISPPAHKGVWKETGTFWNQFVYPIFDTYFKGGSVTLSKYLYFSLLILEENPEIKILI